MGDLKDITKIDVAFNNSSIRSTYYDLLTSEEGETWTMLDEDAESPITTSGLKTDWDTVYEGEAVRARYVRINLRSHSVSGKDNAAAVNSIQEISIYGVDVSTGEGSETGDNESAGDSNL